MKLLEEKLSIWWVRVIAYMLIAVVLYVILNSLVVDSNYFALTLCMIALLPNVIIEALRTTNKFYLFGIMVNSLTLKEILMGIVLALMNIIFVLLLAFAMNGNQLNYNFFFDNSVLFLLIDFLLLASFEEFLFRGEIFQSFYEKFGKIISVVIFSLLFSIVHFDHLLFNWIFFINLFLGGVVLSLMYLQTRSLWLPISFHFCWNIMQQLFLGSNVSGNYSSIYFVDIRISELNSIFYGGELGIEGGLVTSLIMIINIIIVLKFAKTSPYINSKLFKRYYAESELLYNKSLKK